jgi:hypothetical protein
MSFYNVKNSSKFVINTPDNFISQHLSFLRSGFQQANSVSNLTDIIGTDHTYTVQELLNRFLVRSGAGISTDILPTAASIITAIQNQQDVRQLAQDSSPILPARGFYFDCCFSIPYNEEGTFEIAVVSPNDFYELDPSVDGVVTITNCIADPEPTYPIFFLQPGVDIWVRITLNDVTPGSQVVNFSVLTNNCYVAPPTSSAMYQTVNRIKEKASRKLEERKSRLWVD